MNQGDSNNSPDWQQPAQPFDAPIETPEPPRPPPAAVSIGEVIEAAKGIWKENGKYLLQGYLPLLGLNAAFLLFWGIFQIIEVAFGLPFVGALIKLMTMVGTVGLLALFYGMFRPFKEVVQKGPQAVAPGMGFLKLALERIVPLGIFCLAGLVAVSLGGCFLLIPAFIVLMLMYPIGYLISVHGYDLGEALSEGVEILKVNIAPLAAVVGLQVVLGVVIMGPIFGLGVFLMITVSPVGGAVVQALLMVFFGPLLTLVMWFALGSTLVTVIEKPRSAVVPPQGPPVPQGPPPTPGQQQW
ncbi:MAG: hypothetical protein ACNA8W_11635 [Bradymonadaceae bacterium]